MITPIITAFVARFWWQIPLIVTLLMGVWRWDANRIAERVEKGKEQVRVEIGKSNEKAVKAADRVRARSNAPSVRPDPKLRDPYSSH
jgi:hypothetical protein